MDNDYLLQRAKVAYTAYGQTTDFKNFQGLPMPSWDELTENIREAWVNASRAAACYHEPMPIRGADQYRPPAEECRDVTAGVHHLRDVAARLEAGEVVSYALALVPEHDAPTHRWE